jgi:hypothetical protein
MNGLSPLSQSVCVRPFPPDRWRFKVAAIPSILGLIPEFWTIHEGEGRSDYVAKCDRWSKPLMIISVMGAIKFS